MQIGLSKVLKPFDLGPIPPENFKEAAVNFAPVIWLLGKTGAGKTSVIAALTKATAAEIGTGYSPCTKTAQIYDFPTATPLIRFLDTRGLGEAGYDPSEDMRVNAERSHLVVAVMRVSDPNQDELIAALRIVRKSHPDWPLLVIQTGLHDLYEPPGANHPDLYPYSGGAVDQQNPAIPRALRSALQYQQSLFQELHGLAPAFVQVDFTQAVDDLHPPDFGRDALVAKILEIAPEAVKRLAMIQLSSEREGSLRQLKSRAHAATIYFSSAAAGVGAIPVVGIGTVPAAQAALLWHLSRIYKVDWDSAAVRRLLGYLGVATVVGQGIAMAIRQFAKLWPVFIPLGAAQDFMVTYGLGRAACEYLAAIRANAEPDARKIKEAFREGLEEALTFRVKRSPL